MFDALFPRPGLRSAAPRALAAGGVALALLAAGWTPAADRESAFPASVLTAQSPTAPRAAAAAQGNAAHADAGASARADRRITAPAGADPSPGPFAPGGDDLLPVSDVGAAVASAAPATAAAAPLAASAAGRGAPSLLLWLERQRIGVGDSVVLHVVARGVADCRGVAGLQGVPPAGGRTVVQALSAGVLPLTVACRGAAGAVVSRSVSLTVPLPVAATSTDNERLAGAAPRDMPEALSRLQTLADFFQEGRWSRLVVVPGADTAAVASLWARDAQGAWADRSAELLGPGVERQLCAHPAQALTADFNADGRPDGFVACNHGPSRLVLSQPDGRYRVVQAAISGTALAAVAGDVDGDGVVDIVTLDSAEPGAPLLFWRGLGDGRFAALPLPWPADARLALRVEGQALQLLPSMPR